MASSDETLFDQLLISLPLLWEHHAPAGPVHALLRSVVRPVVEANFSAADDAPRAFGPLGPLRFPYFRMGNIDSLDLFGLDELILFSFYLHNRKTYRRVADFGANIGLHTIVLSRCGFDVRSFEPDPLHLERLTRNLSLNGVADVEVHDAAVSTKAGEAEFVRVLGNTTGSHLAGDKTPYGDLERFKVRVEDCVPHLEWADLVKMDIEGHEAEVLVSASPDVWRDTDLVAEVGNEANAARIFEAFSDGRARLFAQKQGWAPVERPEQMPTSHRDGSLFITRRERMPWPLAPDPSKTQETR